MCQKWAEKGPKRSDCRPSLPPFYHFPAQRPFSRTYHFRVFPTIWDPGTGYVLSKNAVLVDLIWLLRKKTKTFQLSTHCDKTEIDFITQEPSLLSRHLEVICRPVQRRCFIFIFVLRSFRRHHLARERSERSRTNAEREKERKIYPVPDWVIWE